MTSLYQLKKKLTEMQNTYFDLDTAETFIKNISIAFAPEDYFSNDSENKKRYYYTEDFVELVLFLAEVNRSRNLHCYLLQCKKCSISFKDMEHFFNLLSIDKNKLSSSLATRIQDVSLTLHFINYNSKKLNYITEKDIIKKKLLFYLIAPQENIKITQDLTLLELQEKLSYDDECDI